MSTKGTWKFSNRQLRPAWAAYCRKFYEPERGGNRGSKKYARSHKCCFDMMRYILYSEITKTDGEVQYGQTKSAAGKGVGR